MAGARVVGLQGTEEAPAAREAIGKGNRSRGRRRQGVGGLHTSEDVGEQGHPWTRPSKGGPCRCELPEGPMSNALTLYDMSPGLRKVVGRESPRATSAEEPDAGNPLVRIWRGAGMGNRPAYSTTTFWHRPCGRTPSGPQHDVARRRAVWTCCVGWKRGRAIRDSGATRFKRDFNAQRWETHLHCTHVAYETTRDAVGLGQTIRVIRS